MDQLTRENMSLSPAKAKNEIMVVSDSEEERQRRMKAKRAVLTAADVNGLPVIEIPDSSDEEESSTTSVLAQKGESQIPDTHEQTSGSDDDDDDDALPSTPKDARKGRLYRTPCARRVVLSPEYSQPQSRTDPDVDSSACTAIPRPRRRLPLNDDVIELTDSSSESESDSPPRRSVEDLMTSSLGIPNGKEKEQAAPRPTDQHADEETERLIPLFVDDDDDEGDSPTSAPDMDDPFMMNDGSILTLNEPRSARKPTRRAPRSATAPRRALPKSFALDSDDEDDSDAAPVISLTVVSPARPAVAGPGPSKTKTPRMSKKKLLQAQRERLQAYAAAFFKEMNDTVFGGGIPVETELKWSNRLLSTAGRAHWRRDREGNHTTSIYLAEKVLDCEERIRNTLSHEMCHLACWIISNAPDEQHGSIFKSWARKVMQKRPDVEVTTRHDYEINHKYRWKCEDCGKIYGRHSKSIDPAEHVCGNCKGRLIPQFETAKRAPKTPKPKADSQNAATRSRDSPLFMPGAFPASPAVAVAGTDKAKETSKLQTRVTIELSDDDGDSDIEILAHTFKQVQITASAAAEA
ncbi:SprT-like family-domain-containing protein [Cubamyces lactineus]|nr:SprT-like family-domain-containing protein [Cubamyces lactineus]